MKILKQIVIIAALILICTWLFPILNKNEYEITQEFQDRYPEYSFVNTSIDSRHFSIEMIDGHEYVVYTYWGKAGGICHHEGCSNSKH